VLIIINENPKTLWVISTVINGDVCRIEKEPPKLSCLRRFSMTVDRLENVLKWDVRISNLL